MCRHIKVSPAFLIAIAFGVSMYGWETAQLLLALAVHEAGHFIALNRIGMVPQRVKLTLFGPRIDTGSTLSANPWYELLTAAAGPLANLFLAALVYIMKGNPGFTAGFSFFFEVSLALAAINLLPAWPLDGGRMLRSAVSIGLGIRTGCRVVVMSGLLVSVCLAGAGVQCRGTGLLLMMPAGLLMAAALQEHANYPMNRLVYFSARRRYLASMRQMPVRFVVADGRTRVIDLLDGIRAGSFHWIRPNRPDGSESPWISEIRLIDACLCGNGGRPLDWIIQQETSSKQIIL